MPVEFPSFDLNAVSDDVKPDLEIVESDSLHENPNPFVSQPQKKKVFKPNSVSEQKELNVKIDIEDKQAEHIPVKKMKPKRPLSEKQKAHLEKMRLKKANKKLDKIKGNIVSNDKINNEVNFVEPTQEELLEMENAEFDSWLKNMDKFEKIMVRMEKEKLKKQAETERKEKAQEAKYFKKFQEQQKTKVQPISQKQTATAQPLPSLDPLKQKENDYYDSFFTF